MVGFESETSTYDVDRWRQDVFEDVRENRDYLLPIQFLYYLLFYGVQIHLDMKFAQLTEVKK